VPSGGARRGWDVKRRFDSKKFCIKHVKQNCRREENCRRNPIKVCYEKASWVGKSERAVAGDEKRYIIREKTSTLQEQRERVKRGGGKVRSNGGLGNDAGKKSDFGRPYQPHNHENGNKRTGRDE